MFPISCPSIYSDIIPVLPKKLHLQEAIQETAQEFTQEAKRFTPKDVPKKPSKKLYKILHPSVSPGLPTHPMELPKNLFVFHQRSCTAGLPKGVFKNLLRILSLFLPKEVVQEFAHLPRKYP